MGSDLRRALMLSAAISLSSCAAVWGHAYKVEFVSSSSITINMDPSLTNVGEVQNVAQAHCAQYGKDAIPQGSQTSPWGLESVSFLCRPRD
jgi:hypothetical protein